MKDLIDSLTWQAIEHHADGATGEFYRLLRETRRLYTTCCGACGHVAYPPRPFCPECFAEAQQWIGIGTGATLYAFTTQTGGLRFLSPDVVGVVEIPGVGRIVSRILGRFEDLKIGMALRFEPIDLSKDLVVHGFAPA